MRDNTSNKRKEQLKNKADAILKRLGDYKCEGQLSMEFNGADIKVVDSESIKKSTGVFKDRL